MPPPPPRSPPFSRKQPPITTSTRQKATWSSPRSTTDCSWNKPASLPMDSLASAPPRLALSSLSQAMDISQARFLSQAFLFFSAGHLLLICPLQAQFSPQMLPPPHLPPTRFLS